MGNPVESWLRLPSCGLALVLSKIPAKYSDLFLVVFFFLFLFMLAFYLTVPHEFKAISLIYFVTRLGYFVQGSLMEGKNTRCMWKVNKLC